MRGHLLHFICQHNMYAIFLLFCFNVMQGIEGPPYFHHIHCHLQMLHLKMIRVLCSFSSSGFPPPISYVIEFVLFLYPWTCPFPLVFAFILKLSDYCNNWCKWTVEFEGISLVLLFIKTIHGTSSLQLITVAETRLSI